MMFLEEAIRRTRRRLLLEEILLLALRTLALLILITVLAGPGAKADASTNVSARAEIVVLDASLSMAHRDETGMSAFQRAREQAKQSLRGMTASRGDVAALILAGRQTLTLAAGDPTTTRRALQDLESPEESTANLAAALQQVIPLMDDLDTVTLRPRVSLYSDLQASTWHDQGDLALAMAQLDEAGFELKIMDTGAALRPNVGILELSIEPTTLSAHDAALAHIRLRNFGEKVTTREITLQLDDAPIAHHTIELAPGAEGSWLAPFTLPRAGQHQLTARVPTDALGADDSRTHILVVEPRPQVVFVTDARGDNPDSIGATFLRYLGPQDPASAWQITIQTPINLQQQTLANADICLLADPQHLPASAIDALLDFLQNNGQLLVLAGPNLTGASAQAIEQLAEAFGLPPIQFQGIQNSSGNQPARLQMRDATHPALRLFQDERWQPLLTEVPHRSYRKIDAPAWQTPLQFSDGSPALLESKSVTILAATPFTKWNRMEEIPGGTLPFLHDLMRHMGPHDPLERQLVIATPIPLSETGQTRGQLFSPDGLRLDWQHPRVTLATQIGVWRFESVLFLADGTETAQNDLFAAHAPTSESDLRAAAPEILQALLPLDSHASSPLPNSKDETPRAQSQSSKAPHPWAWFTALLAILIVESFVAYRHDSRRAA